MTTYLGMCATSHQLDKSQLYAICDQFMKEHELPDDSPLIMPVDYSKDALAQYHDYLETNARVKPFEEPLNYPAFINDEYSIPVYNSNGVLLFKGNESCGRADRRDKDVTVIRRMNPMGLYDGYRIGDDEFLYFDGAYLPTKDDNGNVVLNKSCLKKDICVDSLPNFWDNGFRPNALITADFTDPSLRIIKISNRGETTSDEWELKYRPIYNAIPDTWYLTLFEFRA